MEVHGSQAVGEPRGARRPEGAARAGDQEAQDQHRRLTEQAANVIANQKQTQMRLERAMESSRRSTRNARQARAHGRRGDARRATPTKAPNTRRPPSRSPTSSSRSRSEVEELKTHAARQSTQAADQAKAAVQQNSSALQKKLSERQKLLSQLDQAKMQEQMNKAMALAHRRPSARTSRRSRRSARRSRPARPGRGHGRLQGSTVEIRMLEVEQAQINAEAQAACPAAHPARLACSGVRGRDHAGYRARAPARPAACVRRPADLRPLRHDRGSA